MQKKLIALAVAGLASSAAFAQSNVTIFGTLRPSYDFVSAKDGWWQQDQRLCPNEQQQLHHRFQAGEEALGNGLKAIFKLEYNIDFVPTKTAPSACWRSRHVGWLASNSWGSVKFGAINNALKNVTSAATTRSRSAIGDYNNICSPKA